MPVVFGRSPLRSAAREGLQSGAAQWALVNVTPIAASRSIFGVLVCLFRARCPTQWFRSSTGIKRTFGFSAARAERVNATRIEKRIRWMGIGLLGLAGKGGRFL